jgi:hypothetical protein
MTEQITQMTEAVIEGNAPALKTYIQLKRIEKALEIAIKKVKDFAQDEAEAYGQKSFQTFGAQVELKSAPSSWDYSGSTHVVEAQNRVKLMQQLAQAAAASNEPIFDGDGLQVEPAKKVEGKATISIQLINQ